VRCSPHASNKKHYLPKERILATGDLLVHPVPFAYGSYMTEWIETLKTPRRRDAAVILPGHGPVMRDPQYLDTVIKLFESLVSQVAEAVKRGLSLEDTKKAVNLESFRTQLAGDDPVRKGVFADSIMREAIELAYNAANGDPKAGSTAVK
jgi:glyoxylase-like metal-dependent hydrolase (beta-lactamase superfamily II)